MAPTTVVKGIYWFSGSGMDPSAINSTLFTHIFCAFADLNPYTNRVTISPANAGPFYLFTQTVRLSNPSVKTLLSIGGGRSNRAAFAAMASQAGSRRAFIISSINLARYNGFHGLELGWVYPSSPADMANLGMLVTEWRAEVVREARISGKRRLLLSAAVFYSSNHYPGGPYPVQAINNSLDWVNVMAFDFYGPTWPYPLIAGPSAALYNSRNQPSGNKGITSWIQAGLPPKKIVLGFPYYGYQWRLTNANDHNLFASANGAARDSLTYGQIKTFISQNNVRNVYNSRVVANYCYGRTTWIGFDGRQAIAAKVTYAKSKSLLGYFAWQAAGDSNWDLSRQAFTSWGP